MPQLRPPPLPQRTEATGERLGIARSTACSNMRIRRQRYGCHHRRRPPPNWLAASGVPHGGTSPIQASSAPGRLPDIPRSNAPRSAAVTAARTHRRPSSTVYVRSRRLRETAASSEQRGEGRCPPRDELPPSRHHRRRRHSRNGVEGAVITGRATRDLSPPCSCRKVAARWLPYDPGQDLGIHDVTIEFSPRTAFDSVSMLNDRFGHYFGEPAIPLAILVVPERAIDGFAGTRSSDADAARRRCGRCCGSAAPPPIPVFLLPLLGVLTPVPPLPSR